MKNKLLPVKPQPQTGFRWADHHYLNRNPALDFANTVLYRHRPEHRVDRLYDFAVVRAWARKSRLRLPSTPPISFKECLRLRETIDRFFRQAAAGELSRSCWAKLVRSYYLGMPALGMVKTDRGLRFVSSAKRPMDLRGSLLQSAIELAFSPDLARVKVCPGCGWLFIDRTRNRTKRWCIAALCGNRAKMRRYYERQRHTTARP
ncbi:MAG TPA: CGNR zinc finger domain-containing protein [Aestuariivirgaceae bacterium]|jgi:predicted RNA-binding Zn ribbon-like protein